MTRQPPRLQALSNDPTSESQSDLERPARKGKCTLPRNNNDPPQRRSQGRTSPSSYNLLHPPRVHHRQRNATAIPGARTLAVVNVLSLLGTHKEDLEQTERGSSPTIKNKKGLPRSPEGSQLVPSEHTVAPADSMRGNEPPKLKL